jgi:RND family efflux transporter MFP subunit
MLLQSRPALAALLLAVSLCGCAHGKTGRHKRPVPTSAPVPVTTAKQGSVQSKLTISGVIAPLQNVAITSALSEPVEAVNVLQGDVVKAGQVLAVLNTDDLKAQLMQARGTLLSNEQTAASDDQKISEARYNAHLNISTASNGVPIAQAALQQAMKTLQNDKLNLARDHDLVAHGYLAQQALDQQQTLVNNDEASVRSAQASLTTAKTSSSVNGTSAAGLQASTIADVAAQAAAAHGAVEVAQGQIAQYQAQIDKATITSPVDGVVVNRNLNPGEYPGSRTIFTVQQLSKVYANLNASSADTFAIPKGAAAVLSVSGAGGRQYQSKVYAVLGQVTPGSTNFTVQTILENPDNRLQAGLPVSATISLPKITGISIPTTAFIDDSHTSVMSIDEDDDGSTAHRVAVHERTSDGTNSIVTGIAAGTSIVSNGQLGLADGQSITK